LSVGLRAISKEKLEELFCIVRFDQRSGKWKRKSEAARKLGMDRKTIDKWLAQYPQGMPQKPKMTEPAYFQQFEQTSSAKVIRGRYYDTATKKIKPTGERIFRIAREAWKARNSKDPLTFDLQDFLFFFGTVNQAPYPPFVDPQTNKIEFNRAVALRVIMKLGRARDLIGDLRFTTKGLKREAGRKRYWYLEQDEIILAVNHINEPDTLLFFYLGILLGGRGNAVRNMLVANIHRQAQSVTIRETKIGKTVEKDLFDFSLEFLWQYVIDFDLKDRVFHVELDTLNDRLSTASIKAGLPPQKRITSHMLKHTTVTQMGLHGVDIDVISDYVETDPQTLMDFYRGGGKEKIRAQILDLPRTQETWKQFVQKIHPYFAARYKAIKPYAEKVNGFRTHGEPITGAA
jgi:hypothetical protein